MSDWTAGSDLASVLMEIAQDPTLQQDLDQILGDYCHQCRNRLNSLKLSLYLVKRQSPNRVTETWRSLESDYQTLERQFERVQTICRPIGLSLVTIGLSLLFEDRLASWSKIMADSGRELQFLRPEGKCLARFDVNQIGSALDAMVAWRAEQGTCPQSTSVQWWLKSGRAYVKWSETSRSADDVAVSSTRPEMAWTLPNLTRVVAEHGGTLEVDDQNGWVLILSWPTPTP